MRPPAVMTFNVNTHDRTSRVDVRPDGQIVFNEGQTSYGWVSLDGISFPLGPVGRIDVGAGYADWGGFAPSGAIEKNGLVTVTGLLRAPPAADHIATLPAAMRPDRRLIFNLNSGDQTARVDVLTNGEIRWVWRAHARSWISLHGISFSRTQGQRIALGSGWRDYGNDYRTPSVSRTGDRIVLGGLAARTSGGAWGHVATLPQGMCPESRLIFNQNNHDRTARIDVFPDCRVVWIAGGNDHGWLSLDGISFVLQPPGTAVAGRVSTEARAAAEDVFSDFGYLRSVLGQAVDALRGERDYFFADFTVPGSSQRATAVFYRPQGKKRWNVAITAAAVSLGNIVKELEDTPLDEIELHDATVIYAPKGNNESGVTHGRLPAVLGQPVSKVAAGPFEIVERGVTLLGRPVFRRNGEIARTFDAINLALDGFVMYGRYGYRSVRDSDNGRLLSKKVRAVTFAKRGTWNSPFHLHRTAVNDPTIEYEQVDKQKSIAAWGQGAVNGTSFFIFGQKAGTGKAFAFDAAKASLANMVDVASVLGSEFGLDVGAATRDLPLDAVELRNPKYRAGGTIVDGRPVFDDALFVAASPGVRLPNARGDVGSVLIANGELHVVGQRAARADVWIRANPRKLHIDAELGLPDWATDRGPLALDGKWAFRVDQDQSGRQSMFFEGKAKLAGLIDENIRIEVDRRGFSYRLRDNCPLRPVAVNASARLRPDGRPDRFSVGVSGNPEKCFLDTVGAIADVAVTTGETVRNVTETSYKKAENEAKKAIDKLEDAARSALNKVAGLFGKRKKSRRLSDEEMMKLACAKGSVPGFTLWADECKRNLALTFAPDIRLGLARPVTVSQSSTVNWVFPGLNKRMSQPASKANDGSLSRSIMDAAVTEHSPLPWWEIDLGASRTVDEIVLLLPEGSIALAQDPSDLTGALTLEDVIVAMSDTVQGDKLMTENSSRVHRYRIGEDGAVSVLRFWRYTADTERRLKIANVDVPVLEYHPGPRVRYIRIYRRGMGRIALSQVMVFGSH
jgi:hypothetical protein